MCAKCGIGVASPGADLEERGKERRVRHELLQLALAAPALADRHVPQVCLRATRLQLRNDRVRALIELANALLPPVLVSGCGRQRGRRVDDTGRCLVHGGRFGRCGGVGVGAQRAPADALDAAAQLRL